MDEVDLRARIAAAMVDAAIEAFRQPDQAGPVGLDLDAAQHGAIVALAMLIEADPRAADRGRIGDMCAFMCAQLASQVLLLRDDFEASGDRQWLIQPRDLH